MPAAHKNRYARYAAAPLAVLAIGGLYFGARATAEKRFSSVLESASVLVSETREGLWNYNFLSAREQYLYNLLADAMESGDDKTPRTTFVPTQTEFSAAFDAVLCDYPLYCDLIREECMLVAGDNSAYITLSYRSDGEERRRALSDFADSMIQSAQGVSEWELALFFNDKLTQHCQYSADTAVGHATAYDAVTGDADGYGYALLYALVCREAGIDCGVVRGTVHTENSEGAHAWNVLTLDGVTGYTDVMWNDPANEDASWLPFHGYCFLSADEIGADHTPMTGICFPSDAETKNYYEQRGICIANADALGTMLAALMIDARANLSDCVEFMLDPTVELTDYALEEAIAAAIDAANADDIGNAPRLRQVHRLYRCTVSGGGITVQLFYEENNNEFGET